MNPRATRGIRVLPSIKDGKANGFRITRLSSSSPVSKIGVQRGDVLTSVNGTALTGPDKVLAMMTQLNTLNRVVVTVERRGKPVELTYLLR
jgi:general secretion pathway protein C